MGFILENSATEILSVVLILLWSFYIYLTKNYKYWENRGVPYVGAVFPFGSLTDVLLGRKNIGEGLDKCYQMFKEEDYFGIISGRNPTLVINNPDLIKQILIKDFSHFTDRSPLSKVQQKEYIAHHLFSMGGQDWRNMRLTLSPTFTSGKMKMMFSLVDKCCDQLENYLESERRKTDVVDVKDLLTRFTMDTIASCAFGLDINCLKDRDCEFYRVGKQIFKPNLFRMFRRVWYGVVPILSKLYAPPMVSLEITEFFTKIISDAIRYREKNNIVRNDFLDLLIRIRQHKNVLDEEEINYGNHKNILMEKKEQCNKPALTVEEVTAQCFVFFIAGFETASSAASFCLYELACNQDIQEELFCEIEQVLAKNGGKATYQALQEMTYLDQVINETLRKYPSLAVLERTCTETYVIPDSKLKIEKGTKLTIPIYSLHHDPRHFPEPNKFDPQRFSMGNMKLRHPFLHLPFGEGPRKCIGMRFGLMETKAALTSVLYNYHVDKTPETEIPIRMNKRSLVTQPEKPVLLRFKKRNEP